MSMQANKIHKLVLDTTKIHEVQEFVLPRDSNPIDADWQGDQLVVWYFSMPVQVMEPRLFYIAFTGQSIKTPDIAFSHLKTLQKNGFVFHILYNC